MSYWLREQLATVTSLPMAVRSLIFEIYEPENGAVGVSLARLWTKSHRHPRSEKGVFDAKTLPPMGNDVIGGMNLVTVLCAVQ